MNRRKFLSMSVIGSAATLYAAQSNIMSAAECQSTVTSWYIPEFLEI